MEQYGYHKILKARYVSILIPMSVAILLAFGDDFIMMSSFRAKGGVDIEELEAVLFISNIILLVGVALSIVVTNKLFRLIIRKELVDPLQKLSDGMEHMRQGDYE